MSFLNKLLARLKKRYRSAQSAALRRSASENRLDDLRFQARTGDVKLTEKHRAGKF